MKKRSISLLLAAVLAVSLLAVPALAAPTRFTDVSDDHWALESIEYVVDKGLFNGTSGTTFSPEATMTRAMMWVVLARMDGVDTSDNGGSPWYQSGMEWAVQNDISDGSNPNMNITREELAVMLYRFAAHSGKDVDEDVSVLNQFSDTNDISLSAVEALAWAVQNGIVNGTSGTTISPKGTGTRAQLAALLARYDQTFNGGQADDPDVPDVDYKLRMAMKDKDLEVGDMGIADVKTTPIDARDGLTFTYTSSDPAVAMVEQYPGVVYTCRIMAIAPGTAVITAQDSNGVEASLTVTVSGSSTGTDPTPTPGTSDDDEYADIKAEIVKYTNEVRAENGAAPLTPSDKLMEMAQQRAQESADNHTIKHIRPNGESSSTIFEENGLDLFEMKYTEILAWAGYFDASGIVDAWEDSPGHFAAMTNHNYTLVGVGVAKGDDGRYYYCQLFTNKD